MRSLVVAAGVVTAAGNDIRHACRDVVLQLGGVFEGADARDA